MVTVLYFAKPESFIVHILSFRPYRSPIAAFTIILACLPVGRSLHAADNAQPGELSAAIDFPGGSAEVQQIDQDKRSIHLLPTDHEQKGWRCWWYARIDGCTPNQTFTLVVGPAPWATPDRAAVSLDNLTWSQSQPGMREGKTIRYEIVPKGESVYVAWGPPFVPSAAEALVDRAAREPFVSRFVLTESREGRKVHALRIHQPADDATQEKPYGVWIQARQHAWESGSSWVCRGLVEWLISDDPRAERLRSVAELHVVPIMDVDSVAIGAGGKNQVPHDHNRDWSDQPHWPETAAAMRKIASLDAKERFDLFLDLHNPGATAREPFYFISPRDLLSETGNRNLDRFLAASREDMTGPLPFTGRVIESGANYDTAWTRISKNWVTTHTSKHVVAVTLETAWNTPASTTGGYQQVGAELGEAIERYLRFDPTKE